MFLKVNVKLHKTFKTVMRSQYRQPSNILLETHSDISTDKRVSMHNAVV